MSVSDCHKAADEISAAIVSGAKRAGATVSCGRGCSACCYEPVIAAREEAFAALSSLPPELQTIARNNALQWHDAYSQKQLHTFVPEQQDARALIGYISARIGCPLLDQVKGECMAYGARPVSCRTHIAVGGRSRCADLHKRPDQKFATVPPEVQSSTVLALVGSQPTSLVEFDHLGLWLAEIAGAKIRASASRRTFIFNQS